MQLSSMSSLNEVLACFFLLWLVWGRTRALPAGGGVSRHLETTAQGYDSERVRRQSGCINGELRISKGTPERGYLEYCLDNQFGIVCGDSFDNKDAQVACRQLGYAGAENATGRGIFERRSDNELMYLSNIACNGNEDYVSECPVPGGPGSGIVWRGKVYCSWRRVGFLFFTFGYDYNVAVVNCTTSVMATIVPPTGGTGTLAPHLQVEQIETQTRNFIMANMTLNAIRTAETAAALADVSSLMASLPSTIAVYLFGEVVSRADYRKLSNSDLILLLKKILEFVSIFIDSVEVSEESRAVVGSSLLSILDNLALNILPATSNFSTPNVVVQTQLLRTGTNNYTTAITSDSFDRPQESSIQLPAELLQLTDSLSGDKDGSVRVVSFLYYNVENIFPSGKPGQNGSSLGSGIVSAGLQCGNTFCPTTTSDINLTETVIVKIEHSNSVKEKLIQDSNLFTECVFWKFLGGEGLNGRLLSIGEWSDEGCSKNEELSSVSVTVCECSHLTHFAILLSPVNLDLTEGVVLSLEVITYVGTVVSLLAMAITIATLVILKSQHNMRSYIHINLCINLMIAQFIFVVGVDRSNENYVPAYCQAIAVFLHYFFLVSFMWMLMEGVVLYFILVQVFVTNTKKLIAGFTIVSYGVPLLYMILLTVPLGFGLNDHHYGSTEVCFLNAKTYFIWAFITPVLVIIAANIGFLVMAAVALWRQRKGQKGQMDRQGIIVWVKVLSLLLLVMGITWIFGVLIVDQSLLPLIYIHAILVALQGLFIFLSTVAFQKPIRDEYLSCFKKNLSKSDRLSKFLTTSTSASAVSSTAKRMSGVDSQDVKKFKTLSLKKNAKNDKKAQKEDKSSKEPQDKKSSKTEKNPQKETKKSEEKKKTPKTDKKTQKADVKQEAKKSEEKKKNPKNDKKAKQEEKSGTKSQDKKITKTDKKEQKDEVGKQTTKKEEAQGGTKVKIFNFKKNGKPQNAKV